LNGSAKTGDRVRRKAENIAISRVIITNSFFR
jgi:hypothetical protein